jgi:hypothetical protein
VCGAFLRQRLQASGGTDGKDPLTQSLNELENVLKDLSGKTVVCIFSDDGYDKPSGFTSPAEKTAELAQKHDVSFQVIDYAYQERDRKTVEDIGKANMSSLVISKEIFFILKCE